MHLWIDLAPNSPIFLHFRKIRSHTYNINYIVRISWKLCAFSWVPRVKGSHWHQELCVCHPMILHLLVLASDFIKLCIPGSSSAVFWLTFSALGAKKTIVFLNKSARAEPRPKLAAMMAASVQNQQPQQQWSQPRDKGGFCTQVPLGPMVGLSPLHL